jgi:hypothetical protein
VREGLKAWCGLIVPRVMSEAQDGLAMSDAWQDAQSSGCLAGALQRSLDLILRSSTLAFARGGCRQGVTLTSPSERPPPPDFTPLQTPPTDGRGAERALAFPRSFTRKRQVKSRSKPSALRRS